MLVKIRTFTLFCYVFYSSRVGRSKQAATKENDSGEEAEVFQRSSPVPDDVPQGETEEEEVSTVNVCIYQTANGGGGGADKVRKYLVIESCN